MRRAVSFTLEIRKRTFTRASIFLGVSVFWLFLLSSSQAQVPPPNPITSTGLNTAVSDPISIGGQTQYNITGGTRPGGGANLFHSFGEFGVPINNIANFLNETPAVATSNILGRVTGGNVSNIFGAIQTTGFGNANLFLMNPAGFLFGPSATVNVGGMVSFTSADYLKLTDNARFNAIPNASADALLSASPVASFGFLGSNPGAITVQGSQFSVTDGQSISLVGGNINIEAGTPDGGAVQPALLSAPGGRIDLASVASPGEMLAGTLEHAPDTNSQSFGNLGAIQISEESVLDVSGDGGGTVLIRGGHFVLEESIISANVTGPAAGTPGAGIDIVASKDAVIVGGILESFTEIADSGGAIRLEANGNIEIEEAFIETGTEGGSGHAGNIELTSTNGSIVMTDTFIGSTSFDGTGNSGNIELTSLHGNITMTDFSIVTSQTVLSNGNAGAIRANAPEGDILLANNSQFLNAVRGDGTLGELRITANNLTIQDSGISGDNIGPQLPGNVTVDLSGTLKLIGGPNVDSFIRTTSRGTAASGDLNITAAEVFISDRGLLSTETFRVGAGGHLNILADTVQLTSGGQVRSGSTVSPLGLQPLFPSGPGGTITISGRAGPVDSVLIDGAGSGIFTNTEGTGAGGMTNLSARSLTIQNGGTISASTSGTAPSATGGSITVNTTDRVTMTSGALITASSTGTGNAGNIVINAGQNYTSTDSAVTTQAAQASGGNITVLATDMVQLTNSQLNASVQGSSTTVGGNITIDPQFVILQNSQILAQATQGQGGAISITITNGGLFLPDATSTVSASSQFGVNGTVTIQSPNAPASGKIQPLGKTPLQATSLLNQHCASLAGGEFSSFTVAGRDSLPTEPGSWLASPLALATRSAGTGLAARDEGREGMKLGASPASETALLSLRQIAPAGFLTQAFAVDWSASCQS